MANAILVAVRSPFKTHQSVLDSLSELEELAKTIDFVVAGKLIQTRKDPDPKYYIGYGKLKEIKQNFSGVKESETFIIFNNEISPVQARNIEKETKFKVMTRTEVILEIFSRHAKTQTARIQVDMAKLEYSLSRIAGKGIELSRLGGGIGTRGPGEQKLELERREIRKKIKLLREKLKLIEREKETQRKKRIKNTFKIAIVGYTNAGKSSLLNKLTKANVTVEDKLFATLDTTTRRLWLGSEIDTNVVITDTVGFIRDIPHELIESFKSTLMDTVNADLIIELIDISDRNYIEKMRTVENLLEEMNVTKNRILCFNKIDRIEEKTLSQIKLNFPSALYISVLTNQGIEKLKEAILKFILSFLSRN